MFDLPEGFTEQPEIANVKDWAMRMTVELSNAAVATPHQTAEQALTKHMHKLPAAVRLALLEGGQLSFLGMLVLLSSEDQPADSEDSLALDFS